VTYSAAATESANMIGTHRVTMRCDVMELRYSTVALAYCRGDFAPIEFELNMTHALTVQTASSMAPPGTALFRGNNKKEYAVVGPPRVSLG
jgi:hypothetical protein